MNECEPKTFLLDTNIAAFCHACLTEKRLKPSRLCSLAYKMIDEWRVIVLKTRDEYFPPAIASPTARPSEDDRFGANW
ncbi:hypothetical protein VTP01DRAFT_1291 [Rhizomucor pusillus]|uniref:uncharacterized protein n=1 Tax=Rhizomucor pusillus TaxID=4840 RepID=UPI0037433113